MFNSKMNRVHAKELLEIAPEEEALSLVKEPDQEGEELDSISEFSWKMAIRYLDKRLESQLGKSEVYFLDGRPINDESYLESITMEICQEYSLQLLDIITDLILPIGFKYPSLLTSLHELVNDGFKPISAITQRKTIVWVDDIHWNNTKSSIVERIVCELLMRNVEPFLVAPKYFDQEALSMLSGKIVTGIPLDGSGDATEMKRKSWDAFAILLKFGFMLLLRASTCPLIVLHVSQKIAEIIDGYSLLDLAESEGHNVMTLKNTALTAEERQGIVLDFVDKVLNTPAIKNQNSGGSSSRLPTASSNELTSIPCSRDAYEDMDELADDNNHHLLEKISLNDYVFSDSEDDNSFEDSNFTTV